MTIEEQKEGLTVFHLVRTIARAKADEATAKLQRQAAYKDFSKYVKLRMKVNHIDRGTLRRRLGWPDSRIGNFLHLDYCLTPEWMTELGWALGPLTIAERKAAKRQPKRTKALNS